VSSSSVATAFVVGPDVSATLLTPSSELELGMWMAVPQATTPLPASGEWMPERRFGPSPSSPLLSLVQFASNARLCTSCEHGASMSAV